MRVIPFYGRMRNPKSISSNLFWPLLPRFCFLYDESFRLYGRQHPLLFGHPVYFTQVFVSTLLVRLRKMQLPNKLDDYEWVEEWRKICIRMTNNDIVDGLKLPLRTIWGIGKLLEDSDFDVETVGVRKIQDRSGQMVRNNNFISNVQKLIEKWSVHLNPKNYSTPETFR